MKCASGHGGVARGTAGMVAMQDAGARWAAGLLALLVVASGCAATGGESSRVATKRVSASEPVARDVDPEPAAVSTPAPAPIPAPPPTTVTTRAPAAMPKPAAVPAPPGPSVPTVTIVALTGGAIRRSDGHPCSNISSASITRGQLEVRRSGATDQAVTVSYGDSGERSDYAPLAGQVTIPAGAAAATVVIDPTMTYPAAPAHVHRSSSLAITLNDGAAYDVGPESSAAIGLQFDVDLFGCGAPAA